MSDGAFCNGHADSAERQGLSDAWSERFRAAIEARFERLDRLLRQSNNEN